MKKIIGILAFILWFASPAFGADHYFSQSTGSDAGLGTSVSPWQTLAKAMVECTSPDVCYFNNGDTWTGNTPILTCATGVTYDGTTWGSGTPGTSRAIIRATSPGPSGFNACMVGIRASNITFNGFEIDGDSQGTPTSFNYGLCIGSYYTEASFSSVVVSNVYVHHATGRGLYVGSERVGSVPVTISDVEIRDTEVSNTVAGPYGGSNIIVYPSWSDSRIDRVENITIKDCTTHNASTYYGIMIKDDVDNMIVEGCNIYANPWGIGVETSSDLPSETDVQEVIIRGNYIHENIGRGFTLVTGASRGAVGPVYVYNNIFYNNGTSLGGIVADVCMPYDSDGSSFYFDNNTFYNTDPYNVLHTAAVYMYGYGTAGTLSFRNNIFYTAADIGLYANTSEIDTHSNNLFYRTSGTTGSVATIGSQNYDRESSGGYPNITTWEATAQTDNPLFITLGSDFSLQSSSPAINNGADLWAIFTTDYAGKTRIGVFDIGAYEFVLIPSAQGCTMSGTSFR